MNQIERLIGWMTVAFGASFIFRNTGPAYEFMSDRDIVIYAIIILITNGFALIYQSYGEVLFARLGLLLLNAFVWSLTFITVVSANSYSPFGPVAALCAIMAVYSFLYSGVLLKKIHQVEEYSGEERRNALDRRL